MGDLREFIVWVIIYVIIFFSVLLLVASFRVLAVDDYPEHSEKIDLSSIKTGDIIGASYQNGLGKFIGFFFNTMWSHVGIAWRDPKTNELFILEAANYHLPYRGVFKIPIENWVRFNRKNIIGVTRLKTPGDIEIDPHVLEENFNKIKNVELESFNYTWWRLLFKAPYDEDYVQNHYTCYEIAIRTLQHTGIVKKLYRWSSYTPGEIMQGIIDLEDGYRYSQPVVLHVNEYYETLKSVTKDIDHRD